MVAVCNSLSMHASDAESDIDLFIVSDPDRIWLVRGLVTMIFQLLGVRRYGKYTVRRFCLSFFATTQGMDLAKIAIERDIYLRAWGRSLKPLYSRGGAYEEFISINKEFLGELAADEIAENGKFLVQESRESSSQLQIWAVLNSLARALIRPITLREYERLGKPWGVVISEEMLKFHPADRRVELRDGWEIRQKA